MMAKCIVALILEIIPALVANPARLPSQRSVVSRTLFCGSINGEGRGLIAQPEEKKNGDNCDSKARG